MAKADETQEQLNNFDLEAQKKPRKSTLKKQLKIADSILSATQGQSVVNEFDRIKIWIDLRRHAEHIVFEFILSVIFLNASNNVFSNFSDCSVIPLIAIANSFFDSTTDLLNSETVPSALSIFSTIIPLFFFFIFAIWFSKDFMHNSVYWLSK